MAKRDFYETLGVSRTASDADLKAAFRKAAMQCHPDRHPGDKQAETRFKELNEAYQHLSDAQKRAAYDRFGHAAFEEAYRGRTATIKLPTAATCETCMGSGAKAGSKPTTCKTCAGHGRVRAQ